MVALLIRASTALFGDSELGVRALSLLLVGAMPALIAFIAWRLFGSAEKAALAALMWIAMPLVAIGAVFVTPDAPLVVFWTLGLAALVELWRTGETRWLIALGLGAGPCAAIEVHRRLFRSRRRARPDRDALAAPLARLARALRRPRRWRSLIFAPFVVWNAEHGWATFAKQLGRAPPHGFTPYYLAEFLVAQIGLINPLVVAALVPAVAAIPWRAPVPARSRDEARRILACTIAPAAVYFLLHSLHDRVQGNWLAPLYPAAAILAADWVAEVRRAGGSGFAGAIAKAAPWAAPIGLAVAALTFAEATTGAVPLGPANPLARLEGFRGLARDLDAKARADNAPYVLTQGYALTSLMTYYGDPAHPVVQPEQRMRWIFEPEPSESMFAAPGLALGEPGRHFDLILKMRFREVEPAGLLERRAGRRNARSLRALPGRRSVCAGAGPGLRARRGRSSAAMPAVSGAARSIRKAALRSADPQKDDPCENDERGDRALRVERLAERHDADDRREHDRRLAKRGDGGDRRAGHRPDDDRIAEKGGEAADKAAPPALAKRRRATARPRRQRMIGR